MLSDFQIEQLYKFCEKKGVRYYDIQVELVDHLANSIEDLLANNSSLSFDEALDKVYKQFGIFGFAKVVTEKMQAVTNKQRKLYYRLLKENFGWPKVLLFLMLTALLYTLFGEYQEVIFLSLFVIILPLDLIIEIVWTAKRNAKIGKRKILLNQYRYRSSLVSILLPYVWMFSLKFTESTSVFYSQYAIISSLIVAFTVVALIAHMQMVRAINNEIWKSYPELSTNTK